MIMVHYECPEYSQRKSDICRPKDNIGISCTFSQENIMKQSTTGIRRKYLGPKDNLGIACLPTMVQAMKLRDIPEISEDSSGETHANSDLDPSTGDTPAKQKVRFPRTKITGRARCHAPKDNLQSSGRHVDSK
ncbi:uncharacterized protein LOC125499894 [Athalia rosae]|uniref:uncharacterized protein LOC125499894 n=1 Tax=Athalia rosae TaxID=37344 RepID=UPI0020337FB0|nr:uncharacterized protein LOC125499894 [Athalia rosae]